MRDNHVNKSIAKILLIDNAIINHILFYDYYYIRVRDNL